MVYVFGNCALDEERYQLRRAGLPVPLEPKVFAVLAYLIRHRDRVVTKAELKAACWPGVCVTDDALVRAVVGSRKAVHDDGVRQQLIQTCHGRGYQFVAPLAVYHAPVGAADAGPGPQAPHPAEPPPCRRVLDDVFVGRQAELTALRASLADALAGHGRLVLLAGEPGIGKTRTAQELATYARQHHVQTLVGRCYEGDGAPAFWPWIQVVRAYVQASDPAAWPALLGPEAAVLAAVVPAVRQHLPPLPPPPALPARQARFRFFDSLTTVLHAAAAARPLLLVLDDLHWADPPSLRLLQFLAGELQAARILLVGTYRDRALGLRHPLTQTLGELARVASSPCHRLRGLSEPEVGQFLAQSTGQRPPAALVAALYRQSEGNPFFVKELVRLLHSAGTLERAVAGTVGRLTLPPPVRAVISRRLAGLSQTCVRVLSVAAVLGRDFDLHVLERLSRLASARLLTVLEEGTAAHLLEEVPETVGRYRFSHGLIRAALYAELPTARRVWLHRRIGAVLEGIYGANPEPYLARLAYHFCPAAVQGEVGKAVDYVIQAGQQATPMFAYEEAVAHYGHALQALERQGPVDAWRCSELRIGNKKHFCPAPRECPPGAPQRPSRAATPGIGTPPSRWAAAHAGAPRRTG